MSQNRIQTFDLLKGIAVIFMIQVHIVELFASQYFFNSHIGKILLFLGGPPVAPIFLIAFGFFIAKSNKNMLQLFQRGFYILIVGLLLNIALNFNLITSVWRGRFDIDVMPYIFGVDILINAGIVLLIMAFIKYFIKDNVVFLIIIVAITAFLGGFMMNYTCEHGALQYILSVFYGTSRWSYFPIFPWLSYTMSGYIFFFLLKKLDFNKIDTFNIKIISGISFLVFLFFTFNYAVDIASDLQNYYHHRLVFFLWVIAFAGFYGFFVNETEKLLGKSLIFRYIKWLGENVTLVYIIQWIIIGNIATEIFKTVLSEYSLMLWYVSILAATSIIAYLLLKIRRKIFN